MVRLLAATLVVLSCACSERKGAVERRMERNKVARAAAEAAMREPPPPLALGEAGLPTVLAGVRLGMTWPELLKVRPKAYQSPANANVLHEELGGGTSAHYTLHDDHLYNVLIRASGRAAEATALRADADRRFGAPFAFAGGMLHRAGPALLRIQVDMDNLILNTSIERFSKPVVVPE